MKGSIGEYFPHVEFHGDGTEVRNTINKLHPHLESYDSQLMIAQNLIVNSFSTPIFKMNCCDARTLKDEYTNRKIIFVSAFNSMELNILFPHRKFMVWRIAPTLGLN